MDRIVRACIGIGLGFRGSPAIFVLGPPTPLDGDGPGTHELVPAGEESSRLSRRHFVGMLGGGAGALLLGEGTTVQDVPGGLSRSPT